MMAVCDTGPLIALAKIDRLDLLEQLFGTIEIPPAVHRELLAKRGPEADRLDRALAGFLNFVSLVTIPPAVRIATSRLDLGEQQAIALAFEHKALLVIDDQMGRTAARRLGLAITGLVGMLVRAKERGAVEAVRPLVVEIRRLGYWLSDELVDLAAKMAGEA